MARLSLSFLGPPQIKIDGYPLKLESGRSMGLLAYLALEPKAARRDALVLLLWPESEQSQGRHALSQTIYSIKKSLPGECLTSDRETLSLRDGDDLWIDVRRFRELFSQCLTHGHADTDVCPDCQKPLEKATTLYNGDFLSDCVLMDSANFDDWADTQAETLRREYEMVLLRLVRLLSDQAEHEQAIGYARKWLALDRLNESAHRWLMQLYAWSGDRKAALRQYQDCADVLKAEVNAMPLEETTRLFEDIKAEKLRSRQPVSDQSNASPDIVDEEVGRQLKNRDMHRHNLPAQATQLVGREEDVAEVVALLREPDVRLVTLTGPGGVGKTRLALQVAAELIDEFDAGAFLVALDSVSNANSVTGAVAATLGLREGREQSIADTLMSYLKEKQMLLVLDNFEHVLEAARLVSELLAACPFLKVLVTSREVQRLQGEHEYSVSPLSLPDEAPDSQPDAKQIAELKQHGAVELFVKRATAIRPDFSVNSDNAAVIIEICRRLDGLPLAIELAAARIRMFPPKELMKRLNKSLSLLTRGARDLPPRLQTLRDSIAWSYELLDETEKTLFRRLSVFAGGFSLEMAEALCGTDGNDESDVLDGITSLEEKSLIKQADRNGESRYVMLQTIREYARERLIETGEEESASRRFGSAYIDLAEEADPYLRGPDQKIWLDKIESEYNNFATAFQLLKDHREYEKGLRLAKPMGEYWLRRERYVDGLYWLKTFLELTEGQKLPHLKAWAHYYLGNFHFLAGAGESVERKAHHHFEKSLASHRKAGNRHGEALALIHFDIFAYRTWHGDPSKNPRREGRQMLDESVNIAYETGETWLIAWSLNWRNNCATWGKKAELSEADIEVAMRYAERAGDPYLIHMGYENLAIMYTNMERYETASTWYKKGLELALRIQNHELIMSTHMGLAHVCLNFDNFLEAWDNSARCIEFSFETGSNFYTVNGLQRMIVAAVKNSKMHMAARLAGIKSAFMSPEEALPNRAFGRDQSAKIELDEESFVKEWTIGREMKEKEILAYISKNPFK